MRKCSKCGIEKSLDNFYKHPSIKPDGIRKKCTSCRNVYRREAHLKNPEIKRGQSRRAVANNREHYNKWARDYRANNKEQFRGYALKKMYDISIEQYQKMINEQNGVCAVCKSPETIYDSRQKVMRKLAVDHCHTTGRVRGLLCWACNSALGKLKDSAEIIESLLKYIKTDKDYRE